MTAAARSGGGWRPPRAGLRRTGVACAAAAALLGGLSMPSTAEAQISIRQQQVERTVTTRPQAQFPLYISYSDCVTDNDFEFTLDLVNIVAGESLGVWVSGEADCTLAMVRSQGNCREIQNFGSLQQVMTIKLSARQLATTLLNTESCDYQGSNTEPQKLSLYFLRYASNDADVQQGNFALWTQSMVDLLGPAAPVNLTVGVGEGQLILSYNLPAPQNDLAGFRYYCDDGNLTAPVETGSGGAGGTGGT
ncbi:MAG TPA: hypothetical protein VLS89_15480, partial [Candidatus Nanopelagicales bacterium]|nr:hypothetical protein [Candidatus Nanopelagicales bacterium]